MQKIVMAIIAMSILAFAGIASAQGGGFGEYAGQIIRNISIGSTQVNYWTLVNYYNYSLQFYIVPQNFSNAPGAPKVNYSEDCTPSNLCTILANNTYQINITIFVPLDSTVNRTWSGYTTAYVPPNSSNSSAQIQQGTSKLLEITVVPKPITTTTTSIPTTSATTNTTAGQGSTSISGSSGSPTTSTTTNNTQSPTTIPRPLFLTTIIPTIQNSSNAPTTSITKTGTNTTSTTTSTVNLTPLTGGNGGNNLWLYLIVVVIIVTIIAVFYMFNKNGGSQGSSSSSNMELG